MANKEPESGQVDDPVKEMAEGSKSTEDKSDTTAIETERETNEGNTDDSASRAEDETDPSNAEADNGFEQTDTQVKTTEDQVAAACENTKEDSNPKGIFCESKHTNKAAQIFARFPSRLFFSPWIPKAQLF